MSTATEALCFDVEALQLCCLQEVEESEMEANFKRERAGGNYGGGTKELQLMNFKKRQESDARRNGLFESGLDKFNKKDIQGVSCCDA